MTTQLNDTNEEELELAAGGREPLLDLAEAYQAAGRWAEAIGAYQQALKLQSEDADSHYELGGLYQEVGEPLLAEQSYRRALEVEPGHVESLLKLGNLYWDQQRWLEALRSLQWCARVTNLGSRAHVEAMGDIREILAEHGPELASSGQVRQIETKGLLDAETMVSRFAVRGDNGLGMARDGRPGSRHARRLTWCRTSRRYGRRWQASQFTLRCSHDFGGGSAGFPDGRTFRPQ